jgi:hypothetical protein
LGDFFEKFADLRILAYFGLFWQEKKNCKKIPKSLILHHPYYINSKYQRFSL